MQVKREMMNCELAFRIFLEISLQQCDLVGFRNVIIFLISLVQVYLNLMLGKRF
jgi:hypothetical protein